MTNENLSVDRFDNRLLEKTKPKNRSHWGSQPSVSEFE